MQEALEAGKTFTIEIPVENAKLAGGDAWGTLIKNISLYPGGIADALVHDWRLARTCAGLSSMNADSAATLVSGIGLPALVEKFSTALSQYGEVFAIAGESAATPGSADAWQKLVGTSPKNPVAFFRSVLEKDQGSLAAFYSALTHADAAHQRY